MPWAKFDDRFHDNRKIRRVWIAYPPALGLHVMAITYSAAHLLDGRVDPEFVQTQMPVASSRRKAISALVEAELWHPLEPASRGWTIHDYLDFQPSRKAALDKRRKAIEAGRAGGHAKAAAAASDSLADSQSNGQKNA